MKAMIDIETLGLEPSAVILSVGAVTFDQDDIVSIGEPCVSTYPQFYSVLDIGAQLLYGRTISLDTLAFWQKPEQRDASIAWAAACEKLPPHAVCYRLIDFFQIHKVDELWANGTDFDIPILKSLFSMCGVTWPLAYNAVRDARTIYRVCKRTEVAQQKVEADHTPVNDCKAQIVKLWEHWPR